MAQTMLRCNKFSVMILETVVGRIRGCCAAVGWLGETTLRAHARKAEQQRQRAAAQYTRVCSAFTQKVKNFAPN